MAPFEYSVDSDCILNFARLKADSGPCTLTASPISDTCRAIKKYLLNRRPAPIPPVCHATYRERGHRGVRYV